jgi:LAO/AO transport system kinase
MATTIKNANAARRPISKALHLQPQSESQWAPKVITTSAHSGAGIEDVWNLIQVYKEQTTSNGFFAHHRHLQNINWFFQSLSGVAPK